MSTTAPYKKILTVHSNRRVPSFFLGFGSAAFLPLSEKGARIFNVFLALAVQNANLGIALSFLDKNDMHEV